MDASDKAYEAAFNLDGEISKLVVALGQERLKALQTASIALDQRCAQVAAFQIAAAAFAGALLAGDNTPKATIFVGIVATAFFLLGAFFAFRGVQSSEQHAPGLNPSFWHDAAALSGFDEKAARAWLAQATERAIEFNCKEDDERARCLNWSLGHGIAGGVAVAVAAFTRLF